MKRRKGFTLVELAVVLAIVFLVLLFVLPLGCSDNEDDEDDDGVRFWWRRGPVLSASRRGRCASQLRGLGNATAMYHNDYNNLSPRSFHVNNGSSFGKPAQPLYPSNDGRYAWKEWESKDQPLFPERNQWDVTSSVGSCLFLLVRYEDVSPSVFVCPSAVYDKEIDFAKAIEDGKKLGAVVEAYDDLIDFKTSRNLSYSMNDPWSNPLNSSSDSGMAYLADKSNKFDNPFTGDFSPRFPEKSPNWRPKDNPFWDDRADLKVRNEAHGNSNNHGSEVQNVLFAGGHVERHETPLVGLNEDNIYTAWPKPKPKPKSGLEPTPTPTPTKEQKMLGIWGPGIHAGAKHTHRNDSYLGN